VVGAPNACTCPWYSTQDATGSPAYIASLDDGRAPGRHRLGERMLVLLSFHFGMWQDAIFHTTHTDRATAIMAQEHRDGSGLCGWMGVRVSPTTAAFAESLGMAAPYGAIFDQPEVGSPAAAAGIQQGDVLTTINGSPLINATDFAKIISMMAPGTTVYLNTVRNGETMPVQLIIGSAQCKTSG
jgi:membrane-associated protease RseP (regulator of RpoE activity)